MRKKHYLVYRTDNLVTGHYYYGVHTTYLVDDGYLGSGKRLKYAIAKYGKHNFRRTIIRRCLSAEEMYHYEEKIVAKYLGRKMCYNLAPGGRGGWEHVNQSDKPRLRLKHTPEAKAKIGAANSIANAGERNSCWGKVWLAHDQGQLTMRVDRKEVQDYLDNGWRAGRVMRYTHVRDYFLELP